MSRSGKDSAYGRSVILTLKSSHGTSQRSSAITWIENVPFDYLLLLVLAYLIGRTSLLRLITPFSIGFFAAVWKSNRKYLPGVTLALIIGIAQVLTYVRSLESLAAMVLISLVLANFHVEAESRAAGFIVISTLIVRSLAVVLRPPFLLYDFIVAGTEAFLSAASFLIFLRALSVLESEEQGHSVDTEDLIYLAILLGLAIAGLHGINFLSLSVGGIISCYINIIIAILGGPATGSASGVLLGVLSGVTGGVNPLFAAGYGLAGMMAGLLRHHGRLASGAAYLVGSIILSYSTNSFSETTRLLAEPLVAYILVILTPVRIISRLMSYIPGTPEQAEARKAVEQRAWTVVKGRLRNIAEVFAELSRSFAQVSVAAEPGEEPGEKKDLAGIFGVLANNMCETCSIYRTCWSTDFYKTYQMMFDLLALVEVRGRMTSNNLPDEFRRRCVKIQEMTATINYLVEIEHLNQKWEKKLSESREVVANQLKGLVRIIDNLAAHLDDGLDNENESGTEGLRFEIGLAKQSRAGSVVSGDSYLTKEAGRGKLVLMLSDGMGAGARAAIESKATVALLEHLIDSGFDLDLAVQTVNSILILRSPEETFATVDLAFVDTLSGTVNMIKVGAAPSYLIRGKEIKVIRTESLPIGILTNVETEEVSFSVGPGDVLVMLTDGILETKKDAAKGEEWLVKLLQKMDGDTPKSMAERILTEAVRRSTIEECDDMTVLVAKFFDAEDGTRSKNKRWGIVKV